MAERHAGGVLSALFEVAGEAVAELERVGVVAVLALGVVCVVGLGGCVEKRRSRRGGRRHAGGALGAADGGRPDGSGLARTGVEVVQRDEVGAEVGVELVVARDPARGLRDHSRTKVHERRDQHRERQLGVYAARVPGLRERGCEHGQCDQRRHHQRHVHAQRGQVPIGAHAAQHERRRIRDQRGGRQRETVVPERAAVAQRGGEERGGVVALPVQPLCGRELGVENGLPVEMLWLVGHGCDLRQVRGCGGGGGGAGAGAGRVLHVHVHVHVHGHGHGARAERGARNSRQRFAEFHVVIATLL